MVLAYSKTYQKGYYLYQATMANMRKLIFSNYFICPSSNSKNALTPAFNFDRNLYELG